MDASEEESPIMSQLAILKYRNNFFRGFPLVSLFNKYFYLFAFRISAASCSTIEYFCCLTWELCFTVACFFFYSTDTWLIFMITLWNDSSKKPWSPVNTRTNNELRFITSSFHIPCFTQCIEVDFCTLDHGQIVPVQILNCWKGQVIHYARQSPYRCSVFAHTTSLSSCDAAR